MNAILSLSNFLPFFAKFVILTKVCIFSPSYLYQFKSCVYVLILCPIGGSSVHWSRAHQLESGREPDSTPAKPHTTGPLALGLDSSHALIYLPSTSSLQSVDFFRFLVILLLDIFLFFF